LPGTDVDVMADGRILRQGEVVASLQLFRANEPNTLRAAQGALLNAPEGYQATTDARVRAQSLESSNTDTTQEMLSVVGLSRQFEALSRVIQAYDEVLGRTIEKLGDL